MKRVLLEKMLLQIIKKCPAFYGTSSFINSFTKAGQFSYSAPE
jgi:hypothetical protein